MSFWKLTPLDRAFDDLRRFAPRPPVAMQLSNSLGTVLARDLLAPEELPPFSRSSMDGYAVRSADVAGASEGSPVYLRVVGEVPMGSLPAFSIGPGEAAAIATGGAVPAGADAVVMVERTSPLPDGSVEILAGAAPGEHVIPRGEDIRSGTMVVGAGRRLRPQDLGALAALGITEVSVHPLPRVGVFSTGDELVPYTTAPPPGKIRNINLTIVSATLSAMGIPVTVYGIVPDRKDAIASILSRVIAENDLALITGGSSKGTRDYAIQVIADAGPPGVLHHGLAMKPGQPTVIGGAGNVPVIGLPGHPSSSFVVLRVFVCPLVRLLAGDRIDPAEYSLGRGMPSSSALLTDDVPSVTGREDFVRVALTASAEGYRATPVFGESGLVTTLTRANALLPVPSEREGYEAGETVRVLLLGSPA